MINHYINYIIFVSLVQFSIKFQLMLKNLFFSQHEFPNFQVDIYALVLDNDGSCLGAAIMGASLALANASIPMYGLVTAVTVVKSFFSPSTKSNRNFSTFCFKNIVPVSGNSHGP